MLEQDATGYVLEDTIEPLGDVAALESSTSASPRHGRRWPPRWCSSSTVASAPPWASAAESALPRARRAELPRHHARQVLAIRRTHDVGCPSSSWTRSAPRTRRCSSWPPMTGSRCPGLPLDFLQSAEPKLRAEDLTPVSWPEDPDLEWCPPGHGDVYIALQSSGLLDTLRDKGFRHLFLSNADNLGATCDPRIPAWMAREEIPYVAEVCERTRNDRKGGHLATRAATAGSSCGTRDGGPGEDRTSRQPGTSTSTYNNLWIDLDAPRGPAGRARRGPRASDHRQPQEVDPTQQDSTPSSRSLGDGHRGRGVQGLARPARPAGPLPAGEATNECFSCAPTSTTRRGPGWFAHRPRGPFIDLRASTIRRRLRSPLPARSPLDPWGHLWSSTVTSPFGRDVTCVGDVAVRADGPRTIADGSRLEGDV